MARKPQNEANHLFGTESGANLLTVRAKGGGAGTPSCFLFTGTASIHRTPTGRKRPVGYFL